ncbi:protein of unknown function [Streptomyces sp. DvalAA-14]|nr:MULTISPECIES: DUF1992 domain-containing protein [unclassified Streptomyces]MYS20152.1 DUF1992 domain-containing protein [Streptomyces sp. SID4948]SCD62095.1 protein of unknown function [Streptomyces sp. DvalAA-14]
MTERKPPGVPFETWVDKQIREAEERGAFADLPGAGKPLPSLDTPYDELWWIKGKMQREGLSVLPPTLILRKEAEDAAAAVAAARSERQVRSILNGINEKIEAAIRRPPQGPPLNLKPFDVERAVADWREARGDERRDGGRQGEPPGDRQGEADGTRAAGRDARRAGKPGRRWRGRAL